MQGNSGKYHLILSTDEPAEIQVGESLIKSTNCQKLLGIKIDSKLSFDKHIKTVCKKANTLHDYGEKRKRNCNEFFFLITSVYYGCSIVARTTPRLLISI